MTCQKTPEHAAIAGAEAQQSELSARLQIKDGMALCFTGAKGTGLNLPSPPNHGGALPLSYFRVMQFYVAA